MAGAGANVSVFESSAVSACQEPLLTNAPQGPVPAPVKFTMCGLPIALSVTVIAPVLVPSAVGPKVTLIVQ